MRFLTILAVAGLAAVPAFAAFADDIDAATLEKVRAAATKGYSHPEAATIRNITRSLATNGSGYCGEISIEDMPDSMTTFHVVLETPNGPSVLRLIDFNNPETDPQAATVHELFRHLGCIK